MKAFTLIELLVVITIIVVLLALLTPALDKAIYQAELAVCGTRVKVIATGSLAYTVDYKRMYPYRPLASGDPANTDQQMIRAPLWPSGYPFGPGVDGHLGL